MKKEEVKKEEIKKEEAKKEKMKMASVHELFGITEERADELIKEFSLAKIDSNSMGELAKLYKVTGTGVLGFRCYAWGREVANNQKRGMNMVEKLLEEAAIRCSK